MPPTIEEKSSNSCFAESCAGLGATGSYLYPRSGGHFPGGIISDLYQQFHFE